MKHDPENMKKLLKNNKNKGRTELVEIPGYVFWEILKTKRNGDLLGDCSICENCKSRIITYYSPDIVTSTQKEISLCGFIDNSIQINNKIRKIDNKVYSNPKTSDYTSSDYTSRYNQAVGRLKGTNESKKMPMSIWRTREYKSVADKFIKELDLNKPDAADVYWVLEHRSNDFNTNINMDDIIFCICLYVKGRNMDKLSFARLTKGIYKTDSKNRGLYALVRDKLNDKMN